MHQRAMAQLAAAESVLKAAVAYEDAVASNAAVVPQLEPWPPDARPAPADYSPPETLQHFSRPQVCPFLLLHYAQPSCRLRILLIFCLPILNAFITFIHLLDINWHIYAMGHISATLGLARLNAMIWL